MEMGVGVELELDNLNSTVSKSNEHNVRVVMEISMSGLTSPLGWKKFSAPPFEIMVLGWDF